MARERDTMIEGSRGAPPPDELGQCIAALATDAYWELDAAFRYLRHEGDTPLLGADDARMIVGRNRLDLVDGTLVPDAALVEHNRMMRARQELDIVVPMRRRGGVRRCIRVVAAPRFDADGRFAGYVGYERDVTSFVALRERLGEIALHDELTGLCNRHEFRNRIEAVHARALRDGGEHTLCLLDLDHFKLVNDTAGHAAGDRLLQDLATIMADAVEVQETVARLGGDEFALLLEGDVARASARVERLVATIAGHEFVWDERAYGVGASAGLASMTADGVEAVMDMADSACYAAKRAGRNRCVVFTSDSLAYRRHRRELEHVRHIREALQADRFRLHLQALEPLVPPRDGAPEPAWHATLPWLETGGGDRLAPADFVPHADGLGLMSDLDRRVLERVLDALASDAGADAPRRLSVALSANTLGDPALLERLVRTVRGRDIERARLCIELDESAAVANVETVSPFVHELRALGVGLSLGGIGTGRSAMAHLGRLPVDLLKIDGAVVRHIGIDPTARAVLRALTGLARELGVMTAVTDVGDPAARATLAALGIDLVQESGIGVPLESWPAEDEVPARRAVGG